MKTKALQERTTTKGRWFRVMVGDHGKAIRVRLTPVGVRRLRHVVKGQVQWTRTEALEIVIEVREGHWEDEWTRHYQTATIRVPIASLPKWETMTPRRLATVIEKMMEKAPDSVLPDFTGKRIVRFLRAFATGGMVAEATAKDIYREHDETEFCRNPQVGRIG